MKRPSLPAVAVALVVVATMIPAPALADHRCDAPRSTIDQRACAKAAEGPDALRRFVERTRTIYALYYFDYARGDTSAVSATEHVRVSDATPAAAP
jgi:hypothetical protein